MKIFFSIMFSTFLFGEFGKTYNGFGIDIGTNGSGIFITRQILHDSEKFSLNGELRFYDIKSSTETYAYNLYTGQYESTGGKSLFMTPFFFGMNYYPFVGKIENNFSPFMTARFGGVLSVDGNETSFVDQGFEAIDMGGSTQLSSPRIIASKINESNNLTSLPGSKSFTMELVFETEDINVSPVIDTDRAAIITTTNRIDRVMNACYSPPSYSPSTVSSVRLYPIGNQEYIKSNIELINGKYGLFSAGTKRNLITNSAEYYNLSYEYINDCLRAGIVYRREFYNDSEIEPENSLMFKVTLTPFGDISSPSFSK